MTSHLKPVPGEHIEVRGPRFLLRPFNSLTPGTERAYLVKGLIPRTGIIVVWGPPKCGKSFWTYDAVMHVSLDWEYRGRRVQKGPVVYCAFEGADGFRNRAEAFRQRHLAEDHGDVEFYLVAARANMAIDHEELTKAIRSQLGEGRKPVAVVLDTLNRSMSGSESDDKDMGSYVRAADAIREAFDCAVIIVHHCGIEGSRPRGHTSLTGAADAQLAVKRDAAGNINVTVEWMKDGPEGDTITSRLESVEVGTDIDGDPITSCVVVAQEPSPLVATGRKLSDRHKLALDALAEAVLAHGTPADPAMQLGSVRVAPIAAWRDEMFSRGILDRGAPNPRTDFRRIKEGLHARGLIGVTGELVWLAT
jgi:hypothetical protein